MNPNTNNKNSNAVWYVIIVLVILVAAYFLFRGSNDNAMMNDGSNMASSTNTGGGAMTGGNTTGGSGANNTGGTTGGNVAGTSATIPSDATLTALINVAKVRVPTTATDVALSGGTATYKNAGKDARISVGTIIGKYVTDNGYDVLVNMSVQKDPAALVTSNYVALFFVKDNAATFTSAVYVGEGVRVTGADAVANKAASVDKDPLVFDSQVGYVVTIHYLDRRTGETATTTPTQAKDLAANVRAHSITK